MSQNTVAENNPKDTVVGTFSAIDSKPGGAIQFSFIKGTGSEDNHRFSISDQELRTNEPFNFEANHDFSVRVLATATSGESAERIFQINVRDLNDPPFNTLPSSFHGFATNALLLEGINIWDEDAGTANVIVTLSVTPAVGTFFVPDDIPGGLAGAQITGLNSSQLRLDGSSNQINKTISSTKAISFFPASGFNGNVTLTMTTDDLGNTGPDGPKSTTNIATLDIVAVNNPPTIAPIADPSPIDEDAGEQLVMLSGITPGLNESDSAQLVTIEATSDNPLLIANVSITGLGSTRQLRYTPLPNANGVAHITVTLRDDGGSAADGIDQTSITFRVVVNSVNDSPKLDDATFGFANPVADGFLLGTLHATDADLGDETTYQIDSGNADGAITLDAKTGRVSVSHANLLLNGSNRTLVVRATDLGQLSDTAIINLVQNQPPSLVGSGLPDLFKLEDDASFKTSILTAFTDDGPLKFDLLGNSNPELLSVTLNGAVLNFVPKADQFGTVTIRIRATDLAGQMIEDEFVVTLAAVNDRPSMETAPAIISEILAANAINNLGSPVSLFSKGVSDRDPDSLRGIAIVGTSPGSKFGVWEISDNSGTTWNPIDSVSESHAFLLADLPENRIRFKPLQGFSSFADLRFKTWDRTTGHSGGFADSTKSTAFSLEVEKATTIVGRTIPMIDAHGNPRLSPVEKDATNPVGDPVRNLLGLLATDPDLKSTIGIAVTGMDSSHGHWEYSISKSWISIAEVSDGSALLLSPTSKIRFVPEEGFAGTATLSYHAWDQSVGQTGERADVSGNAFSISLLTASIQVVARPVLDVSTKRTLATINSSTSVHELLNGAVAAITPVQSLGMAITGTSGKGVWSYQIGKAEPVKITATPEAAFLLPTEAILHFTPSSGFIGIATLSYRAWNMDTFPGAAGTRANSTGMPFSKAIETLSVFIPSPGGNSRPLIGNRSVNLGDISEDPKANSGITVQSILPKARISDANRTDRIGLAISAIDKSNGDWQFSPDGKSWATLGEVSSNRARLLPATARIRFIPKPDFFGVAECSFLAWDGTDGSPGDLADGTIGTAFSTDSVSARWNITPVNDRPTLDVSKVILAPSLDAGASSSSIRVGGLLNNAGDVETAANQIGIALNSATGPGSWQVSSDGKNFIPLAGFPVLLFPSAMVRFVGNSGKTGIATLNYQSWDGTPARGRRPLPESVSLAHATFKIAIGNSAPQLTGPGAFDDLNENPKFNLGKTVASFLGDTFLDSPGSKRGIAVTEVTNPIPGIWQYSLNRGKTWISMNSASETDAWLLPESAKIRFAPAKDAYSSPGLQPSISYKAWDQTVGSSAQRADTTNLSVNAFSTAITVRLTVAKITQLPKLDTSRLLIMDAPQSVSQLFAGIASSRETNVFGISVISMSGPGTWQIDLGIGFMDIKSLPAKVSQFNQDAVIRFLPKPGATGLASLRFKAWDPQGDADRVSREIETVAVSLGNHRPVLEVF